MDRLLAIKTLTKQTKDIHHVMLERIYNFIKNLQVNCFHLSFSLIFYYVNAVVI